MVRGINWGVKVGTGQLGEVHESRFWWFAGGLGHFFLPPRDWPAAGFCFPRAATPKQNFRNSILQSPSFLPLPTLLSRHHRPLFFFYLIPRQLRLSFTSSLTDIMFRSAVVRSLRASVPRAVRAPATFQIRSAPAAQFAPRFAFQGVRLYSAPAGLNKEEAEGRIVNLLKNFDKVCRVTFPPRKRRSSRNHLRET